MADSRDDDLPEPHDGMSPEEKGDLLSEYLHARRPVAGLDFSHASLMGRNYGLEDMSGASFRHAQFDEAELDAVDLGGSDLTGASFTDCRIGAETVEYSAWSAEELRDLHTRGAVFRSFAGLPKDVVEDLIHMPKAGLTLTFDTRLHRFDATAFDAFIAEVLGPETDVTIEERSAISEEGPGWIRINGPNPDELVGVAEAFYDRAWRTEQAEAQAEDAALTRMVSALEALFGPRLEEMRNQFAEVKASTDLFADEDVREAITDKAREHVGAKRKKTNQTRLRRIAEGLMLEAPKAFVSTYLGESVGEVAGELVGETLGAAVGAVAEAFVDEVAEEVEDDVKGLLENDVKGLLEGHEVDEDDG